MSSDRDWITAAEIAARLGADAPRPEDIPKAATRLVAAVRALVAAAADADVEAADDELIDRVENLTRVLHGRRRDDTVIVTIDEHGRVDNLSQAASGRLNPQALPLRFDPFVPVADGPGTVEITGRCILTAAHQGPPGRAHGGVVATMLDEALGVAAFAAGTAGVTAGLSIDYRAPTPIGVDLEVTARYLYSEGRAHHTTGEVRCDGTVTAAATGLFVTPK